MSRFLSKAALVALVATAGLAAPVLAQDITGTQPGEPFAREDRVRFEDRGDERDATREEWRRVAEHLRGLGYSGIRDVDVEDGHVEVDAISPRGREVDVYLDRTSLKILFEKRS